MPGASDGTWHRAAGEVASGTTDSAGRIAFALAGDVQAAGHLAATASYQGLVSVTQIVDGHPELMLELEEGLPLEGRLVTSGSDRGVSGVPVSLLSADLPLDGAGRLLDTREGGLVQGTVSDEEGGFRFTVPPGRFALRAGNDEWTMKRPRRGPLASTCPGSVIARAGETDLRIELDAFRFVRFELIDARSGKRTSSLPSDIVPVDLTLAVPSSGPGRLVGPASLWTQGGWRPVADDYGADGVYAGIAPVPATGARTHMHVMLRVPRFEAVQARLRLLSRSAFDAGAIDAIRLQPADDGATASLRVHKTAPYAGRYLERKALYVHTWDGEGDGYSSHQAERDADGWLVLGLPARVLRVVVDDGVQLSEEMRVDLSSGGIQDVHIEMPPATGFVLDLRSPRGTRVLRPAVWARLEEGFEMQVPDFTETWDLDERLDPARPMVFRLPLGTHSLQIFSPDGGWLKADVSLAPGEVETIRSVMREPVPGAGR
jgi:hypothetical protein